MGQVQRAWELPGTGRDKGDKRDKRDKQDKRDKWDKWDNASLVFAFMNSRACMSSRAIPLRIAPGTPFVLHPLWHLATVSGKMKTSFFC